MLVGIALRTYVTHSVSIVWIVNIIGLVIFCGRGQVYGRSKTLVIALLYILFNIFSILINVNYLSYSIKAIGTNINILVFPIYFVLCDNIAREKPLSEEQLQQVLKCISLVGFLVFLYAIIIGRSDIINVFRGTLNVYRANNSGFFYGKNIYGAFISLTIAADLYLLTKNQNRKRLLIILIKFLGVVLSFSRAALLQAALMFFIYLWLARKRAKREWIVMIFLLVIIILLIYTNQTLYNFFDKNVLRFHTAGDAGRADLRAQAISRIGDVWRSSLFGVGFAGIDALQIDIDNTYLYLFFSGGGIKIVFYIGLLITWVKTFIKARLQNSEISHLSIAVGISYFAFAYYESIALFELGLLNFMFTLYMIILPIAIRNREDAYGKRINI